MKIPDLLPLFLLLLFFSACKKKAPESDQVVIQAMKKFQIWERLTDDKWEIFRRVEFKYDNDNQLIEEMANNIQGDSIWPAFRTLSNYDESGNTVSKVRENWFQDSWILGIHSSYQFQDNRIVERLDSIMRNNQPSLTYTSYHYNGEGQLTSEVTQRVEENQRLNQTKVIYHYNEQGLEIEKEYPIWKDDQWINSRKMILLLNEKGQHIQTTRFNWKNEEWLESIHYELEVDENGVRQSERWQRPGESGRSDFMRISYVYY